MKTLDERYIGARDELRNMGFAVSAGSWIDEEIGRYYVCSVETCGQLGHPAREISGTINSQWTTF